MKKLATLLLAVILCTFTSCLKKRDQMSHEKAIVIEKQHQPDTRQTVSSVSFDSKGRMYNSYHEIGDREKFMVVFKCQHGNVFTINRSDLYGKVRNDDTVLVDYYEMIDGDGVVKDYDFVDANKVGSAGANITNAQW